MQLDWDSDIDGQFPVYDTEPVTLCDEVHYYGDGHGHRRRRLNHTTSNDGNSSSDNAVDTLLNFIPLENLTSYCALDNYEQLDLEFYDGLLLSYLPQPDG